MAGAHAGQGGNKCNLHQCRRYPDPATELKAAKWDTGVLEKGQSKTVTFSEPGSCYYICAPHPWMYGQVIVE